MSDVWVGVCCIVALVALDVAAVLFGYDSRDGLRRPVEDPRSESLRRP